MDKIKNIALIVLGVMVLWLFADRYVINSSAQPTQTSSANASEKMLDSGSLRIAYLNVDSILMGYNQAIKMNQDFGIKQKSSEEQFAKKAKSFEKQYMAFQEKVQRGGFLSQSSMELQQRDLMKQREELEALEGSLTQDLMGEQQRLNEILYQTIVDYVRRYNVEAQYDLIFTNTGMGTIMHGDPGLNITPMVIEGLNAEYVAK